MPQFTEFPTIPNGEPARALAAFIDVFKAMPAGGEPFRELRKRLKAAEIYSRERLAALLRFFQLAEGETVRPNPLILALRGSEAEARKALAERLWTVNPLLLATVYRRLEERVHSVNELLKFLDSFAYPGTRLSGPDVRAWVRLAQSLGLFKLVGIRLALSDDARTWFAPRVGKFDVEEFLDEDQDEPEVVPEGRTGGEDGEGEPEAAPSPAAVPVVAAPLPPPVAPAAQAVVAPAAVAPSPFGPLPSPLGRGRPVAASRFAGGFSEAVRAEAVERITGWWAEQKVADRRPGPEAFGLDHEQFQEDGEQALFRLAVAAALVFRDAGRAVGTFAELDEGGALAALYAGTRPDGPLRVDADALMTASLVARRAAEHPDLAAELEKAEDAEGAFAALEGAYGRGLFGLELFWMLRGLVGLSVVRRTGSEAFAAVPEREVRNVLFRLGFLDTPYAADGGALRRAAAAATPFGAQASLTLTAFSAAAGCRYGCPHRKRCDLPCRERADLD